MTADPSTALSVRLVAMAADGIRPACGDPDTKRRWTSEDPDERALAQRACNGCPATDACLDVALVHRATAGVYAGTDFTDMTTRGHARLRAHVAARRATETTDTTDPLF